MKKLLFFVVLACLLAACGGITGVKGSGNRKTETRSVSGFKQVKAGGAVNLDITFKPEYSVTVEADDNLLEYITTTVSGDELVIESKDRINPKSKINIKITMPELTGLDLSGASTANAAGLRGEKLDIDASGACEVKIDGEARELKARASGASSIKAENLKVENADVDASGASNITVNASGDLRAEASGASSVTYIGSPRSLKQNSSGASSINKK
jgi:hypothetical protein